MEKHAPSTIHRAYTLTHCDFTANLTLSVSNNIHIKMVSQSLAISHESDNTLLQLLRYTIITTMTCESLIRSQLLDWQTRLHKDDVVAEWKKVNEEISLHVHCFVSGTSLLQDLAAEFRYHIFSKELPLVSLRDGHQSLNLNLSPCQITELSIWI